MLNENERIEYTPTDILLVERRRHAILMLIFTGRIDANVGMDLYDETAELSTVLEERQAMTHLDSKDDSPLGRLYGLFFKLRSNPEKAKDLNT